MPALSDFLTDKSGASAIEYAVIAAGIATAIVVAVGLLGVDVQNKYTLVLNKLNGSE